MKILEITTFLRGGAGTFLVNLACEFVNRGHDVDVISSGEVEGIVDWDELMSKLHKASIRHMKMNFFKRDNEIFWNEVSRLVEVLKSREYDIIHAHAGVPTYACQIAMKMANKSIPLLATFHSWGKNRPNWMDICDAYSFNQCGMVIYDSNEYMKFGREKGIIAESDVIYPGIMMKVNNDIATISECRRELTKRLGIPYDSILITNLAEITQRKGQIDIVKALRNIISRRSDVYLCLIGESRDEEYYNELMTTIEELNLQKHVFFLGWVKEPYEFVAMSNLFVFPTYSEGLGLAIVEAIVLGVPTIFSSVEGTKDIEKLLGHDCFGTFDPGDYEKISKLSLEIIEKREQNLLKIVNESIRKVSDSFSFDKTVSKYELKMEILMNK